MKKILTKKGFTLIELIVVIAILAILAAILIPSITNYVSQANRNVALANARTKVSENSLLKATDQTYDASGSETKGSWTCTWAVDTPVEITDCTE